MYLYALYTYHTNSNEKKFGPKILTGEYPKRYLIELPSRLSQKATAYHGITTELAVEYGVNAQHVFVEFTAFLNQLPDNGFVIAHKMEHEDPVFKCNLNEEQ